MTSPIRFHPDAARQLAAVSRDIRIALLASASSLAADPRPKGSRPLIGSDSVRVLPLGPHRIIYAVNDAGVTVLSAAARRDSYSPTSAPSPAQTRHRGNSVSTRPLRTAMTSRLRKHPLKILISMLKGGAGKTTSAILVAIALAKRGFSVALICADSRSRGATDWCQEAERKGYTLPFQLWVWIETDGVPLSKYARQVSAETRADIVIIDTGGEQPEAFTHGCMFADLLICAVAPTDSELRRMVPTYMTAVEVIENGSELDITVLLNRVPRAGVGKAAKARSDLNSNLVTDEGEPDPDTPYALGIDVFATEIARDGGYADAYGTIPDDTGDYERLADELVQRYALEAVA